MKKILLSFVFLAINLSAFAVVPASNPRAASLAISPRSDAVEVDRGNAASVSRASRRVTPTMARSGILTSTARTNRSATSVPTASVTTSRAAASRSASPATPRSATQVRTAQSPTANSGVSRAATNTARATAVFSDVNKIGTGYANCRDAYNTCMDQFCSKSNDTFRRCSCSARIDDFKESDAMLFEVKTMLQNFQDVNLDAVGRTEGEVNAMFTATVGEQAIKSDTSAAAKALADINDLISGKKKPADAFEEEFGRFISFSSDVRNIFDISYNSIFSNNNENLADLTGLDLYNAAHEQCIQVVEPLCENDAVKQMSRSAYSILITQDCNLYQDKIDTEKQDAIDKVMLAEKFLRDARLEEYRAHNSADMNACIAAVKTAVTQDMACGTDYKKCLDYTGRYVKVDGTPFYSPRLFELGNLINLHLSDNGDVLANNRQFNEFLDTKQIFAKSALDTCRDTYATDVWTEFKRQAMIEIAQAQAQMIEDVKSSCVETITECYDSQSGLLKKQDSTRAQISGALNAYTSQAMCRDQVTSCAALYAGPGDEQCKFDTAGNLTTPNCGMRGLLTFVSTVDNVKIAEGCETALLNYARETCTPKTGGRNYPYDCRLIEPSVLRSQILGRANLYCADPVSGSLPTVVDEMITRIEAEISEAMDIAMEAECDAYDGVWIPSHDENGAVYDETRFTPNDNFFTRAMQGRTIRGWGMCADYTPQMQCEDEGVECQSNGEIELGDAWYKNKCETVLMGGWDSVGKICWYNPNMEIEQ